MFLLSAGTLFMEHFERTHKELAFDLFNVILQHLPAVDLLSTNIADPIAALALQQVAAIKELHIQPPMWRCLAACLDAKHPLDAARPTNAAPWNIRDDAAAALLQRMAFESDAEVRVFLIAQIPRVFAGWQLTTSDSVDDMDLEELDVLKRRCLAAGCCLTACRWTRKLAKILPYHVSCCFGPATDVRRHLRAVHRAYLSTLHAMPVRLCAPALRELLDELPTHLVQLMWHHRADAMAERQQLAAEVCALLRSLGEQIAPTSDADDDVSAMALGDEWRTYLAGRAETLAMIVERLSVDG